MDSCIVAVEAAFRAQADGTTLPAGALGTHATDGGFHVKAAGLTRERAYYVAKVNANFPGNQSRHGLPTVQGVVALFDATDGRLLALMDSMEITTLRTAAATAVAAKSLARTDARTLAILGCGIQGRSHLRALARVRSETDRNSSDMRLQKPVSPAINPHITGTWYNLGTVREACQAGITRSGIGSSAGGCLAPPPLARGPAMSILTPHVRAGMRLFHR